MPSAGGLKKNFDLSFKPCLPFLLLFRSWFLLIFFVFLGTERWFKIHKTQGVKLFKVASHRNFGRVMLIFWWWRLKFRFCLVCTPCFTTVWECQFLAFVWLASTFDHNLHCPLVVSDFWCVNDTVQYPHYLHWHSCAVVVKALRPCNRQYDAHFQRSLFDRYFVTIAVFRPVRRKAFHD